MRVIIHSITISTATNIPILVIAINRSQFEVADFWFFYTCCKSHFSWKRNKTNTVWANVKTRLSKTFTLSNSSNSSSDQFTPFSTLPLLAPHLFPRLPKWPILLSTLTAPSYSPQYSTIMHRMLDDTSQSSTVFQNTSWWSTNQPCQSWLSNRQGRHTLWTIHCAHLIWIMMMMMMVLIMIKWLDLGQENVCE